MGPCSHIVDGNKFTYICLSCKMTQWDFVGGSEEGAIAICAQFLKHITSHYEGFQKCMSHAFYASTILLSDHFGTEQQH